MVAGRAPACTSMRYCSAAPTAPPPGAIFESALPASCEAITGGHAWARMATCCSAHRQASVASCSAGHRSQPAGAELAEVLPGGEEVEQAREHEVQRDRRDRQPDGPLHEAPARGRLRLAALDDLLDVGAVLDRALHPIADARPRRHRHGAILHGAEVGAPHPAWVIRRRARSRRPVIASPMSFAPMTRQSTAMIAALWAAIHSLRSSSTPLARAPQREVDRDRKARPECADGDEHRRGRRPAGPRRWRLTRGG